MRKFATLLMLISCSVAYGQETATDAKAGQVKALIMQAFGGEKALLQATHFSYTIKRTAYSSDTVTTRTHYSLDLERQHIQEKRFLAGDSVIKWIGNDGGWLLKDGHKSELPEADEKRLQQTFLTNFIPMLRNNALVYEYKTHTKYKGKDVQVVQVYTPQKKALIMDLFIDAENGRILTTSRPDNKTGEYTYFADELDYQPIGKGIIFPLVYQVWVQGKLTVEGRFENVLIR